MGRVVAAPGPSTSNPASWPTQRRPSWSRASACTCVTPAPTAVGPETTSPETDRRNNPPAVPIQRLPSGSASSEVTIATRAGTTGRNFPAGPRPSRTKSPPWPPAHTRPARSSARTRISRRVGDPSRGTLLKRRADRHSAGRRPVLASARRERVEPGHTAIGRDPIRAITSDKEIVHRMVRQPVVDLIRDELGPVETTQSIDGTEPQEAARIAHDSSHVRVRKALLGRVRANRQTFARCVRGNERCEHEPECRQRPGCTNGLLTGTPSGTNPPERVHELVSWGAA